jgi:hypothetical protein
MVDISQLVESQIVVLNATGSSPVIHPNLNSPVGGIGRRDRLKICSLYKGVGSSPIQGTKLINKNKF